MRALPLPFSALLLSALVALTGCVGASGRAGLTSDAPAFDVARAFVGASAGEGRLKIAFRRTRPVHVESSGHRAEDGTIVVDQVITEPGRKTSTRQWRLREVAPGRYAGSLSDATGPVEGVVRGNCLELRFRMKGDLTARQWLFAMPDGRTVQNRMSIRKSGILVARMRETITRRD
ncbi:DUF3833 family protein [Blastomonas sp. UPD001]|uniref:DUF3833 family protein n=1 Tax=Blastomonas sp. UPD001 TaxID=2217673 RepID=UPI00130046C7|nr:DUF3833 family protein [Blastomonas sp. UPD001]MBL0965381.1 DUF3833 family protein [Blastomonas sp.]